MKIAFSCDEIDFDANEKIDVLVLTDNSDLDKYTDLTIDVCIYDNSNINSLYKLKKVHNAVSCGMGESDSVTFSSISGGTSLVCIRRQIIFDKKIIYPCEFRSVYFHSLDLYSNLAFSLIKYLMQYDV